MRTLLEYRGSFNRFDLRISKVQAEGLAQLFFRIGEARQQMAGGGAPLPPPPLRPFQHRRQQQPPPHSPAATTARAPPRAAVTTQQRTISAQSFERALLPFWAGGSCSSGPQGGGPSRPPAEPRGDRRERNGLIFVCDQSTEEECLSRRLLGLPKSQSTLLSKLRETSLLFLFNVKTRQLIGVLHPDGPAGLDLEPAAWGGGRFPVQVRFTPAQPSGQLMVLQETLLGDVLRYRAPACEGSAGFRPAPAGPSVCWPAARPGASLVEALLPAPFAPGPPTGSPAIRASRTPGLAHDRAGFGLWPRVPSPGCDPRTLSAPPRHPVDAVRPAAPGQAA